MIVAYRKRGSFVWTHHFRVDARRHSWRSFYAHARLYRQSMEYAYVLSGEYVPVLA